jgi:hypothetical protein
MSFSFTVVVSCALGQTSNGLLSVAFSDKHINGNRLGNGEVPAALSFPVRNLDDGVGRIVSRVKLVGERAISDKSGTRNGSPSSAIVPRPMVAISPYFRFRRIEPPRSLTPSLAKFIR